MINQEIKSKQAATKVAKELRNDITKNLKIFGSYLVELKKEYMQVRITSPDSCSIITGSAMENILEVVKMYQIRYWRISYHIDIEEVSNGTYIPAVVVCIGYEDKL